MPDLSACYFCGTALEEPLSEYPVVPKTLEPTADQQRNVVLCDGCRRKLGRVLDTVLEAVDERPIDATVQQGRGGEPDAGVDGTTDLLDDESGASGDADETDADESATDADDADDSSDDAKSDVSAAAAATSGWSTVNVKHSNARRRSSSDADDEGDDANDEGDDADDESAPSESRGAPTEDDDGATGDEGTSASAAGGDGATADDADDANDADDADDTDDADDADDTDDADDADDADGAGVTEGQTLSRLEYSKIMRLLENREFPVDRAEIRVVATNAYEIRPEEFDAVVDAAVKRGLLVEENGKFVEME